MFFLVSRTPMSQMFVDGGSGLWHKRVLLRLLVTRRFSVSVLSLPWHVMFPGKIRKLSLGILWEGHLGRPPEGTPGLGGSWPSPDRSSTPQTLHARNSSHGAHKYFIPTIFVIPYWLFLRHKLFGCSTGIKYLACFSQKLGSMCDTFDVSGGIKYWALFFCENLATREMGTGQERKPSRTQDISVFCCFHRQGRRKYFIPPFWGRILRSKRCQHRAKFDRIRDLRRQK